MTQHIKHLNNFVGQEQETNRIVALCDMPEFGVCKGDRGGTILDCSFAGNTPVWVDFTSSALRCFITAPVHLQTSKIRDINLVHDNEQVSTFSGSLLENVYLYGALNLYNVQIKGVTSNKTTIFDYEDTHPELAGFQLLVTDPLSFKHNLTSPLIYIFTNVGSSHATLYVFKTPTQIYVSRGCFSGTLDEFEQAVNENIKAYATWDDPEPMLKPYQDYLSLIRHIRETIAN